jgi:chemotaxis protein histidine kinase CheA
MDDALLKETLTRLMRERTKEKPEADEQAKEEEPPVMQQPLIQQSQERSLIQQVIAEVKAELADEELEVKDEITDADTLQELCQPVSSSSAADADASNAADSSAADADASNAAAFSAADADASKEEPEADEEGHGEFAQSTHSQPTSQAVRAVQAHADAPSAAAHVEALWPGFVAPGAPGLAAYGPMRLTMAPMHKDALLPGTFGRTSLKGCPWPGAPGLAASEPPPKQQPWSSSGQALWRPERQASSSGAAAVDPTCAILQAAEPSVRRAISAPSRPPRRQRGKWVSLQLDKEAYRLPAAMFSKTIEHAD